MINQSRAIKISVAILVIGNIYLGYNYLLATEELQKIKSAEAKVVSNEKVIDFTSLFIKKVLQADKEVDFETRLSLENAVRNLKDEEIMAQWSNFVGSKTEAEAQNSVKNLLGILVAKIQK